MKSVIHSLSLCLALFGLWLLLSGMFTPLFIGLGLGSSILVTIVAGRMKTLDREGWPLHLLRRSFFYWPWLLNEIFKANIAVSRIILSPTIKTNQRIIRVKASQKTDLGRVILANSITLTPGTITVEVEENTLLVHALTDEAADEAALSAMDQKVTLFEGSHAS
ncbi:MAG: Na+/H+ antiporter subunit E [Parvularculales bacterium]